MSSRKEYYLREASQEAEKSILQCRHGAIIVKGGKIISRGYNKGDVHAECSAIHNLLHTSSKTKRRKKQCVLRA